MKLIKFENELPYIRTHSGSVYKDKIYYFGGWVNMENKNIYYRNLIEYSIVNNQWKYIETNNNPSERSNHSSCIYQNELIIYGGFNGIEILNDLYSLDLISMKWKKYKGNIKGRDSHTCVLYKDDLYIFGGRSWNNETRTAEYLNEFYQYSLKEEKWNKIEYQGYKPLNRLLHGCIVYNDSMFIFGGRSGLQRLNDLLCYNFLTNHFQLIHTTESPSKRTCRALTYLNHSLFLYGGYDINGYCNDFWKFDLKLFQWKKIKLNGNIPESRCAHICSSSKDYNSIFIYGGEGKDKKSFNDFYIYEDLNHFKRKLLNDSKFLDVIFIQ